MDNDFSFQTILKRLKVGQSLSRDQSRELVGAMLDGQASPAQIGAVLMGLSLQGETVEEIVGAAQALRMRALIVTAPDGAMDCCGTGGDHSNSLNISTATAFVAASCGVPIAKHGNRAASSQSGAADVLEAMGVYLPLSVNDCQEALSRFQFCFLMAPSYHAALKPLAAIRKELGFRTLFNILGPLANPASTRRQLLGVFDQQWLLPMAQALQALGSEKAWVVHGSDGLDEITLCGETFCAMLAHGQITEGILTPADFGLPYVSATDLQGGTAFENAQALHRLLDGEESAYQAVVLANSAAVLVIHGKALDLRDGVRQARDALRSGRTRAVFMAYRDFSQSCASVHSGQ